MYKVLEQPCSFMGTNQDSAGLPNSPLVHHNYRYSRQIIPGRGPNLVRLYAQKSVAPRDRHSITDTKDPFGGQFGRKAHLEGL